MTNNTTPNIPKSIGEAMQSVIESRELKALKAFEVHILAALDASKAVHHRGYNLAHLRQEFDHILNKYLDQEYSIESNYTRELSRTEQLRKELKPRHKKEILERDKYRCTNCGSHKNLCIDHKTPISRGGDNSQDNLQTLCRKCNCSKGNKTMQEWQEWLEDK